MVPTLYHAKLDRVGVLPHLGVLPHPTPIVTLHYYIYNYPLYHWKTQDYHPFKSNYCIHCPEHWF